MSSLLRAWPAPPGASVGAGILSHLAQEHSWRWHSAHALSQLHAAQARDPQCAQCAAQVPPRCWGAAHSVRCAPGRVLHSHTEPMRSSALASRGRECGRRTSACPSWPGPFIRALGVEGRVGVGVGPGWAGASPRALHWLDTATLCGSITAQGEPGKGRTGRRCPVQPHTCEGGETAPLPQHPTDGSELRAPHLQWGGEGCSSVRPCSHLRHSPCLQRVEAGGHCELRTGPVEAHEGCG